MITNNHHHPLTPANNTTTNQQQENKELDFYDPLNVEHWYKLLQNETFPSYFIKLTYWEAEFLVQCMEKKKQFEITNQNTLAINILQKIDNILQSDTTLIENGFFVRLSSRSPKDASLKFTQKVEHLLTEEYPHFKEQLQQLSENNSLQQYDNKTTNTLQNNYLNKLLIENEEVKFLVHTFHKALKVKTSLEAIELLIYSTRSYHDLHSRLLKCNNKDKFEMQLIIRKWIELEPCIEFRAFVGPTINNDSCHNNNLNTNLNTNLNDSSAVGRIDGWRQMNCITQYFTSCYLKEMTDKKDIYLKEMILLFEKIKFKLKHLTNGYVIDFAIDKESGKIKIVELNHFHTTTGSGLFDWKVDRKLFENGLNNEEDLKELDYQLYKLNNKLLNNNNNNNNNCKENCKELVCEEEEEFRVAFSKLSEEEIEELVREKKKRLVYKVINEPIVDAMSKIYSPLRAVFRKVKGFEEEQDVNNKAVNTKEEQTDIKEKQSNNCNVM
ncbi:hypothetical protein ABK040_011765 [Willaertia magna]